MKYMGSKNRIARHILPIILKDRVVGQYYIEPFVGGCNSIDKVIGPRIGVDNNKYLIAMWQALPSKTFPQTISRELYNKVRTSYNQQTTEYSDEFKGWVGFMGSYNGRFFDGGYSGHEVGPTKRDYIREQINNTLKQVEAISDVHFIFSEYGVVVYPPNSIIYCDIPYKGTKQYSTSKNFDYDKFYKWCLFMCKEGHEVFISEYDMPPTFECIYEKVVTNSMSTTNTSRPTEKLYKVKEMELLHG